MRSGKINTMKVLLNINDDVIIKKQQAIAAIAPRLQYSMPPLDSMADPSHVMVWDPPFADGVDVMLDGLFERAERLKKKQSSGIPPKLMSGREWGQLYDSVRVKIPSQGIDGTYRQREHLYALESAINKELYSNMSASYSSMDQMNKRKKHHKGGNKDRGKHDTIENLHNIKSDNTMRVGNDFKSHNHNNKAIHSHDNSNRKQGQPHNFMKDYVGLSHISSKSKTKHLESKAELNLGPNEED
jgi:hypothetical protein